MQTSQRDIGVPAKAVGYTGGGGIEEAAQGPFMNEERGPDEPAFPPNSKAFQNATEYIASSPALPHHPDTWPSTLCVSCLSKPQTACYRGQRALPRASFLEIP